MLAFQQGDKSCLIELCLKSVAIRTVKKADTAFFTVLNKYIHPILKTLRSIFPRTFGIFNTKILKLNPPLKKGPALLVYSVKQLK